MDRCHLKRTNGDAIHAVLCAAGYNIRWLLRMIRKKGIRLYLSFIRALGLGGLLAKIPTISQVEVPKRGQLARPLA